MLEYKVKVWENIDNDVNDIHWFLDNKKHCKHGPAVLYANGYKAYYIDDERHREDGPAIIHADGSEEYWVDGKRHREDGPAVKDVNGDVDYWVNGKRHRENGPAVIRSSDYKAYWTNGKRHREDGPAIIYKNGTKQYFIHGKQLSEEEFNSRRKDNCDGKIIEMEGNKYKLQLVKSDDILQCDMPNCGAETPRDKLSSQVECSGCGALL